MGINMRCVVCGRKIKHPDGHERFAWMDVLWWGLFSGVMLGIVIFTTALAWEILNTVYLLFTQRQIWRRE